MNEAFEQWWNEKGCISKQRFFDGIAEEAWTHQQTKLDAQEKELAALRAFAQDVFKNAVIAPWWLTHHSLIDADGKPTPLLTGEKE